MQVSKLHDGACLRVPLSALVDAPWGNVRQGERDPKHFSDLKTSIAQRGVVQAIAVRPNDDDNTLEVLAGYGRRDASMEIGLSDIPAVIKRVGDKEGMAIGLTENLQRENLSVVQEAKASQDFVSLHDGDYEEAAKALGWPERKVRARIKLNDCSESVLDALARGKIKIGHAEVLCQFVEKLQDNTLKLVLDEGWSIDYLKERANKATRLLRHAKFDISECQQCPHNSTVQAQLFDNHVGTAKCGQLPCYREKSDAWVQARKAELESEEGTVLLNIEKPATDRNTVSEEIVGTDAFADSCLGCEKRVRILQDGINKNCGEVTDDQCIDIACFKKMVQSKSEADAADQPPKAGSKTASKKATKASRPRPTLSAGMKDQARQFVRKTVGKKLLQNESYRLAAVLLGLADLTGYSPNGRSRASRSDAMAKLAAQSPDDLRAEIDKAICHGTIEAGQGDGHFTGTDVVLKSAKHVENAKSLVIAEWVPTKDWLTTYQKGAIEGFCKQRAVGFSKAYDAANGRGAFTKLMKKRKDDIIGEILAFEFDWSPVAPKELVDLVK